MGEADYSAQLLEIEHGVTDTWTTALYLEGVKLDGADYAFGSFRFENRVRLFREATLFNPVLYAEYEQKEPASRYIRAVTGRVDGEDDEDGSKADLAANPRNVRFGPEAEDNRDLRNVRIPPLGAGEEITVSTIWQAPSGNLAMPGSSFFGLMPAGPGLRPGDRAKITAERSALIGVVVPAAARAYVLDDLEWP